MLLVKWLLVLCLVQETFQEFLCKTYGGMWVTGYAGSYKDSNNNCAYCRDSVICNGPSYYCYCPGDGSQNFCTWPTCGVDYYFHTRCTIETNNWCRQCSSGYFCPGDGNQYPCTVCPSGISFQIGQCTTRWDTACSPCKKCDWYNNDYESSACNSYQNAVCSKCIANSVSSAPAKSVFDCQCNPGYYGQIFGSTKVCTPCIANSMSSANANSVFDCRCNPGYFGQVTGSTKICVPCPANSTSPVDAKSYLDCYCKLGYYGQISGPTESTCKLCPPNQFCPSRPIKVCPCNKTQV
jgi:hypothetical protein